MRNSLYIEIQFFRHQTYFYIWKNFHLCFQAEIILPI